MVICGIDMVDPNVPYRLISRSVLAAAIAKIPADFEVHNVALTYRLKQNSKVRWVNEPIRFMRRRGGVTSINVISAAKLGINLIFDLWRLRRSG